MGVRASVGGDAGTSGAAASVGGAGGVLQPALVGQGDQRPDGADGVLAGIRPGTVWADISTIAPDASVALAERVIRLYSYVDDVVLDPFAGWETKLWPVNHWAELAAMAKETWGLRPLVFHGPEERPR